MSFSNIIVVIVQLVDIVSILILQSIDSSEQFDLIFSL